MLDFIFQLNDKEKLTFLGILLTLIITVINLIYSMKNNNSNIFANTIIKERLESLTNLKEYISQYTSLIEDSLIKQDFKIAYKDILYYSSLIKFQLNPLKSEELDIIAKIDANNKLLYWVTNQGNIEDINEFKKDIYFFRGLNISNYNEEKITQLLFNQIKNNNYEFDKLFKGHIKNEWEKIKSQQKNIHKLSK